MLGWGTFSLTIVDSTVSQTPMILVYVLPSLMRSSMKFTPSSVEYCTFHHGYNMGIGLYNTDDLELNYNVGQGISGPGEA